MPLFPDKKGFYWTLTAQVFQQLAQNSGQRLDQNTTTVPWDPAVFASLTKKAFPLVSASELRRSIREDLMIMKLRGLVEGANYVSTYDAYEQLAQDREEIAIEYAVAKAATYDKEVRATPPTDEELKKHYEATAKAYEIGVRRTCEMLVAEVDDLIKLISIDDTAARARYDANRDSWMKSKGAQTDAEAKAVESGPFRKPKKEDDGEKDDSKKDDAKKDDAKKDDDKKDDAAGGGGADLFEPQVGGAPAGEPKQEPKAEPAKQDPAKQDPAKPGEEDPKQPEKPVVEQPLPYEDVQIQVRNQMRRDRAINAADSVVAEIHHVYSDLEADIVSGGGDPLEEIGSLQLANKRLAADPERYVPDATGFRLSYRKISTFRTESELRENDERTADEKKQDAKKEPGDRKTKPIADFVLKDGSSIAREVADLYSEVTELGRVSRPVRTGTARALVRFLAQEPPRKPTFDEVRDQVLENYYAKRAMELAKEAADKCVAAVKSGETVQTAASNGKMDYGTSGWFMRGNRIPFLPSGDKALADAPFFDKPKGAESATAVPDLTRRQYIVATVYDRRRPTPAQIPEQGWLETVPSMQAENRSRYDARFTDPDAALARHEVLDFTDGVR
jgi:hypothetical protein